MTASTLGDLLPMISAGVVALGVGGKGLRYVRSIVRGFLEAF